MWRALARLRDRRIPKLYNLRRAQLGGIRVPRTVWCEARELDPDKSPEPPFGPPWIVRSAAPTEDTLVSSAAGQFVSRNVVEYDLLALREALREVLSSLPTGPGGEPLGAVFVQPLLRPESGGVCFHDGFYYEVTSAPGGNQELTGGTARGELVRGTLGRGDPWSDWLRELAEVYAGELEGSGAMDYEFAREGTEYTLLQARPALFEVRRNPVLSLANHREILGDPPSPWIADALEVAGRDALSFFAEVDGRVASWKERYAIVLGGRAWLNVSFFHRLMDHWGLPRSFVEEGIGGHGAQKQDTRLLWRRFLLSGPRLIALQWKNLITILRSSRELRRLASEIEAADDLHGLFLATASGLALALRTNFAINGALTGVVRIRQALGIRGRARVRTEEMMHAYEELRRKPRDEQGRGLDEWLARFGHRGPLESDPARPRFHELRDVLLEDLSRSTAAKATDPLPPRGGPLFALDRRRESFRDELMQTWSRLRKKILETAARHQAKGELDDLEDVFLLQESDLEAGAWARDIDWPARKRERQRLTACDLPATAPRDELERILEGGTSPQQDGERSFRGIALSPRTFEGSVRKASDLVTLLREEADGRTETLGPDTVLLVPALEPSWAVVFGRVGAVLTELGGELSHASILLREARKPAIVNCPGIFSALRDGERVRLDGEKGRVEALS